MIRARLHAFFDELRAVGFPISPGEKADALRALCLIAWNEPGNVRAALGATLVKRADHLGAFHAIFDIFFSRLGASEFQDTSERVEGRGAQRATLTFRRGRALSYLDNEGLSGVLRRSLAIGDRAVQRLVAQEAVARYSGFQPGRPVSGSYYVMRTLRALDLASATDAFSSEIAAALASGELDALGARLRNDVLSIELDLLRKEVEAEVRRLVADDRGAATLARALRKPLPEDMDLMSARGGEIDALRDAAASLAFRLADKLKRRQGRKRINHRRTFRQSISYGGVPVDLRFSRSRRRKPDLVILADVSQSVASFARFTLHLISALHDRFSRIRCFVFIERMGEVSALFEKYSSLSDVIDRINHETALIRIDGRSDYGNAFRDLAERYADVVITPRSILLILGDARNNYHAPETEALKALAAKVSRAFWLNPERRDQWNTGDSIASQYERVCHGMWECRSLTQLRAFVEQLR
jgi:uncharacterized protein with von Willebrand factor type A (vWA) domain